MTRTRIDGGHGKNLMARTWLSIRLELVEGRGERFWPRPGRIFAAARRHTFAQLADAIDDAFARWDRAHLHDFTLADGRRLTTPFRPGEQFVYVFDFGDDWTHVCTVGGGERERGERLATALRREQVRAGAQTLRIDGSRSKLYRIEP